MLFKGKKITLMGLGVSGGAVEDALFFIREGARVTVTDLKPAEDLQDALLRLQDKDITLHLGGHREEDFTESDLVIKNPAVPDNSPYLDIARRHGVAIDTRYGIFCRRADMRRTIGITGTKGKSTTTSLIHRIVQKKFSDAYLTGVPGNSMLSFLEENKKDAWGVLELSSWALEGMAPCQKNPHIAVITNIARDHLNRYKSYEAYREAKKLIFRFQEKSDYLVLNYDDEYLRGIADEAPSRVIFFSAQEEPRPKDRCGAYITEGSLYSHNTHIGVAQLKLNAALHPSNIVAAFTVAQLLDIPFETTVQATQGFEGLEGRTQYIASIHGTAIYNDTAATNPYATVNSIRMFPSERIALIVGGEDKNLDYGELAQELSHVQKIILLPGSASDKIREELDTVTKKRVGEVSSLADALDAALSSSPDVLLFSPAAASFNMFKNEFDRGDQFNTAVAKLKDQSSNAKSNQKSKAQK